MDDKKVAFITCVNSDYEGRIQKFTLPTDEATHIDLVKSAINPAEGDIIVLKQGG